MAFIAAVNGLIGNVSATGISTAAFLQATTLNVGAAATIPTLSGTTGTFTNITATGSHIGNFNATGVSTAAFLKTTTINVGVITATSFVGDGSGLTGVTATNGTISGIPLGSNLATLTLNTSGTGLSGSTTYNGGTAATFTVTSNATSANTASAIVARDASGNFSAGTISASDITLSGNLTVNGTTTTINSTTLTIDDKNIELGSVASPTDVTADGGGITLKGATDKTFNWLSSASAWTSSEDINVVTGKQYEINGTSVLSSTALGSGVVSSSLTSVGNLGNLTVSGGINGNINATGVSTVAFLKATTISATGVCTASSFSGPLANTLTLNTSGTGLSGSTTFNNSGAATFTVTSNATNANTASTIVARDASGNFSAGTITANLTGNVTGTISSTTNIPNLTGAITSNNTTTSLGSFTSAQLATALTDETGSGANVFATSPTLVSPALGTPSSGTLTNCTFPTLNQNTTGTASNITAYTINQNLGTANAPTFAGLTVSADLQPNANNTIDCGTSANRWRNVYSNDLDLSNEGKSNSIDGTWGSYLIQEGKDNLYIINRRSKKKFRFVLEELV